MNFNTRKLYLVTDGQDNFVGLLAKKENVDDILDYDYQWKEIYWR